MTSLLTSELKNSKFFPGRFLEGGLVFLMSSVCLNVCFLASYHIFTVQTGGHLHNDDGVTLLEWSEMETR